MLYIYMLLFYYAFLFVPDLNKISELLASVLAVSLPFQLYYFFEYDMPISNRIKDILIVSVFAIALLRLVYTRNSTRKEILNNENET